MNKRLTTIAATAAGVVLTGSLVAVPALGADTSSTTPASSTAAPLTDGQRQLVDEFLTDHPGFAQALARRAKVWHEFLAAHPDFAAEIDLVLALPAGQRAGELRAWLREHPGVRHDLREMRRDLRRARRDARQDRRDRRQDRRDGTTGSATSFGV